MADSTEILMFDEMHGLIGSGVHLCGPCADLTEADQKRLADGSFLAKTAEQFLGTLCPECRQNASKLFTPDPWDEESPYQDIYTGRHLTWHEAREKNLPLEHLLRVLDEQD